MVERPCLARRCAVIVRAPNLRCPVHQKAWDRRRREDPLRTGQNGVRRDQRIRKRVLDRDRHTCVACGAQESDACQLAVHHRDGDPRNNRYDNLETRCPACHTEADGELRRKRMEAILARRGRTQ